MWSSLYTGSLQAAEAVLDTHGLAEGLDCTGYGSFLLVGQVNALHEACSKICEGSTSVGVPEEIPIKTQIKWTNVNWPESELEMSTSTAFHDVRIDPGGSGTSP